MEVNYIRLLADVCTLKWKQIAKIAIAVNLLIICGLRFQTLQYRATLGLYVSNPTDTSQILATLSGSEYRNKYDTQAAFVQSEYFFKRFKEKFPDLAQNVLGASAETGWRKMLHLLLYGKTFSEVIHDPEKAAWSLFKRKVTIVPGESNAIINIQSIDTDPKNSASLVKAVELILQEMNASVRSDLLNQKKESLAGTAANIKTQIAEKSEQIKAIYYSDLEKNQVGSLMPVEKTLEQQLSQLSELASLNSEVSYFRELNKQNEGLNIETNKKLTRSLVEDNNLEWSNQIARLKLIREKNASIPSADRSPSSASPSFGGEKYISDDTLKNIAEDSYKLSAQSRAELSAREAKREALKNGIATQLKNSFLNQENQMKISLLLNERALLVKTLDKITISLFGFAADDIQLNMLIVPLGAPTMELFGISAHRPLFYRLSPIISLALASLVVLIFVLFQGKIVSGQQLPMAGLSMESSKIRLGNNYKENLTLWINQSKGKTLCLVEANDSSAKQMLADLPDKKVITVSSNQMREFFAHLPQVNDVIYCATPGYFPVKLLEYIQSAKPGGSKDSLKERFFLVGER